MLIFNRPETVSFPFMKKFRYLFVHLPLKIAFWGFSVLLFVIAASNIVIHLYSTNRLFDKLDMVPIHKTAIVLGTSRLLKNGQPNPWFYNRMNAAAQLYHAGKVRYIILSGDNRSIYYNEPEQMRRELVKAEVPDSVLYLDYAGLRTLDSMVRSREIFGQDSIIVVSQKFHNQRAVFLARAYGIYAVGFNAPDPEAHPLTRVLTREMFARVKVFFDLITGKQPRFLGEEIEVGGKQ